MIVGSTFISDLVLSSALYFGLVSVVRFGLIISFHLVNKQNTAFCDSDYISSIHHIRSSWERILHCSRNRSQGVYPQRSPLRRWCQVGIRCDESDYRLNLNQLWKKFREEEKAHEHLGASRDYNSVVRLVATGSGNILTPLKLGNVKNKGHERLLQQIRTNLPCPQCFSENRTASLKAVSTTKPTMTVEEVVKRKEEEEQSRESNTNKEGRGLDVPCCNDLLRFTSVNLDHLTETFNMSFYMTYLARWPDYFHVSEGHGLYYG
ncbi:Uncharacterized protein Rs2_50577 [Raphanus sativus]|nr:Uncharacterized protein Rs2_50577 [Raphanus sativus]